MASEDFSRWLIASTTPDLHAKEKLLSPRLGCKNCWSCRRPDLSSLALLNHRLQVVMPSAPFDQKVPFMTAKSKNRFLQALSPAPEQARPSTLIRIAKDHTQKTSNRPRQPHLCLLLPRLLHNPGPLGLGFALQKPLQPPLELVAEFRLGFFGSIRLVVSHLRCILLCRLSLCVFRFGRFDRIGGDVSGRFQQRIELV